MFCMIILKVKKWIEEPVENFFGGDDFVLLTSFAATTQTVVVEDP